MERALLWRTTREQRTIEVSLSVVDLLFRSEAGNHQPSISRLTLSAVNNRTEIFDFSKEAPTIVVDFSFFKRQNFSKGEKRLSGFILSLFSKQTNIKLKKIIKNIFQINLLFSFLLFFSLVDFKFPFKDHIIIVSVLMKRGIDEMLMRPVTAWKCAAEEKIEAAIDPETCVGSDKDGKERCCLISLDTWRGQILGILGEGCGKAS